MQRTFVGITGASGQVYALELVRALLTAGMGVDLCATESARKVLGHELGLVYDDPAGLAAALGERLGAPEPARLRAFPPAAVEAPASSGTALVRAVVLCPCSMGTLARVAAGFSSNLVERAADVALKEGRPLILVPRETPLSAIHLENMLKLVHLGAVVLPAMPGFYHHPRTLEDLVGHVIGKVLDRLGIPHGGGVRWSGALEPPPEPGIEPQRGGGRS